MRTMTQLLTALLFLLTLNSACGLVTLARISVNQQVAPEDLTFLQPDRTTLSELVARLGTPDEITASDGMWVATYHFLDTKYTRVNYGTLLQPWTPISPDMITEGMETGMGELAIVLDSSWHVRHVAFSQHRNPPTQFRFWPFARQTRYAMPTEPATSMQVDGHAQIPKTKSGEADEPLMRAFHADLEQSFGYGTPVSFSLASTR
jgi:hypothetical protein